MCFCDLGDFVCFIDKCWLCRLLVDFDVFCACCFVGVVYYGFVCYLRVWFVYV